MRNNRCAFRATINIDKVFGKKTIDIEMSDFYGCLRDSVEKPLRLRVAYDQDVLMSTNNKPMIAREEAKRAMYQFRQAVIAQAEMFFEEFYRYNVDLMADAILDCLQSK